MATYLTLDARFGVVTFNPSNGYPVITEKSELIDDADVIPILEIASAQTPAVYILVSDHPITDPTDGVPASDYITSSQFNLALATVVRTTPQTFDPVDQTQARANIDAEQDGATITGVVHFDTAQSLTDVQKAQARDNIGASDGSGGGGGGSGGGSRGVSPYDHGAVGDGTHDDTAALIACETAAFAKQQLVDLGYGTYRITGPVKFGFGLVGNGGNESDACVIKCDSATASVSIGYASVNDTAHPREASGFVVDMNGKGDPTGRFNVYAVKTNFENINVTDNSVTGTTVSAMTPGVAMNIIGAQNCHFLQVNTSAVQGAATVMDNGVGGCTFDTCHFTTAGTLLRITDTSPGTPNTNGFPFGPADNSFTNCIFETRLADSVQLIAAETGSMNVFERCQFSVSTNTGVITSHALINITSDVLYKGLNVPFPSQVVLGNGCSFNGGLAGAVGGSNPVYAVSVDGANVVALGGEIYAQDVAALVYNKAGAGTGRLGMTGLTTGGGYGGKTAANTALSDAKQSISVNTGVTSYTLTFGGNTTSAIGPADTAASIQTKLQALASIGSGNILVTGENGAYIAHWVGSKAGAAQALMTVTASGGTVTITAVQTGGVAPSMVGYTNALNSLRLAGDFSRTIHLTPVVVASLAFNADVSAYPEIQFAYVNNSCNLTSLALINPSDGQIFTVTHQQSAQGESSYVWPSNCLFRGATPVERAANGVVSVTFRYYKTQDVWFEESRSGDRQLDLPYYAGALQHEYRPASAGYNVRPSTMHSIKAKLAKTVHGDSDTHIVFLGDSTLGGYGGGAAYAYDTCVPRSMARGLATKLGVPWQQGIQYAIGDKRNTPSAAPAGLADNWAITGSAAINSVFLETTSTATLTRSPLPGETGTAVDLYYSDLSTNGVAWSIDGTAQTVIPTSNTNTIRKVTVTGLSNAAHTIVITGAAGKIFILLGTRIYTPATKALHIHNLSVGGSRANGGANDLNWSSTSNSGTYGLGYLMPAVLAAAGITPDYVIVSIGGNDISNGTDAPTTLTGMDTMFGFYPTAPGLIVHAHKVSGVVDATYNLLSKGKFEHADSLNKAMFNWDEWVQGLATATADGLIGADATHPTAVLQTMVGQQLATLLSS